MSIRIARWLLAGFALLGAAAQAQTWENPFPITSQNYVSTFNSCAMQPQNYVYDYAYPIYAPAVVYRVAQLLLIPPHTTVLRPWTIYLYPPPYLDLSIWVCKEKYGNQIDQCVDESDNWGPGLYERVTVPARVGLYYIVVTGGYAGTYPTCGPYTFNAIHG